MTKLKNGLLASAVAFAAAGGAEGAAPVTVNAANNSARSFALGAELSAITGFDGTVVGLVEAGEKVQAGPLTIMFIVRGAKGDAWLHALPEVDSKEGNNAETYKVPVKDVKTGETKMVNGNAFTDLFAGTAEGIKWKKEIEELQHAMKPENHANRAAWLKGLTQTDMAGELKTRQRRMSTGRSLMKRMAKCWQQYTKACELPGIKLDFEMAADGLNIKVCPYPVTIYNAAKPKDFKSLSVSQFLAIDFGAATKAGGSYDNVLATLSREGGGGQGDQGKVKRITDVDTFHEYLLAIVNYTDFESDDGRKHQAMIVAAMVKNDELVKALASAVHSLDPIYGKVERRAEEIIAAEAANGKGEKKAA